MVRRVLALLLLTVTSTLALAGFAVVGLGTAQTEAPHISFVLATGSTGGTYFPVGQAIAEIISHPPGAARCELAAVCGPPGLIASTRSSLGSVANVRDVNDGRVDSGLAQSDILAEAVSGKGEFRKSGPQTRVRVIADLFPEEVHLVASRRARIRTPTDLKGKRVAIGPVGSGTAGIAREILAAWSIPERRVKESNETPDLAAQRLARGEIDAFFFVGGAPVSFIGDLVSSGRAELVPLAGSGRNRLLVEQPGLSAETITASEYPAERMPIDTVGVHAIWIVNENEPANLVYRITEALFSPANRAALTAAHPSARAIRPETATQVVPAPLHPGAAQFYRETGVPGRVERHS
ncbi:MAG TPA: TAXI family TRAP transporter solute-binding subunit [Rhizomicrobium sp.]|nr:TAXI family TRAP transporter solute-binding subunit [Rhizomicrobium sp.]